jgi:hypothetical protein
MHEYQELMAQQRAKQVRLMVFGAIIALLMCVGGVVAGRTLFAPAPQSAPTVTSPATAEPVIPTAAPTSLPADTPAPMDSPALTDTPAPIPTNTPVSEATPTPTPIDSPTPTSSPTPTEIPTPTSVPSADPPADVVSYDGLAPVESVPAGVDIRAASASADLRVTLQTAGGAPAELSGWAEGEALMWIALYDPIPDPPTVYTEWVFVLDLDGDATTGRPVGSVRINPDLGIEVAVGVYYDPAGEGYSHYSLVWDPAQGSWADGPEGIHYLLSDSRTLVGLALPLEALTESAERVTGVTTVPGAVRGRAAALAVVEGLRIVDFYPDRPD